MPKQHNQQLRPLGIYASGPGHSNQTFAYVQRVSEDLLSNSTLDRVVRHPPLYCYDHVKFLQAWELMRLAEELIDGGEAELKKAKRSRKAKR